MRRIGRYILNTLTVLSLVLCVGTVGLWVRSNHDWMDSIRVSSKPDRVTLIYSRPGSIAFGTAGGFSIERATWAVDHDRGRGVTALAALMLAGDIEADKELLGITVATGRHGNNGRVLFLLFRDYYPVALFALLPVIRFCSWSYRRTRSRQREAPHRCANCNYDLRATPDRCPECGTIPTKVKA